MHTIPAVGDLVYAQVLRVTPGRGAECRIVTSVVNESYRGLIRPSDIVTPALQAELGPIAFRAGDLVRAKVISLGDARNLFLSTVPEDCGVVSAGCDVCVPVSWKLISDGNSVVERRKVAKV